MKQMNRVYPKINVDFDAEFLFYMVGAIFSKTELKQIIKQPSLRLLDRSKLGFIKRNSAKT